jgi:ABC-type transporter Mla maintaining outer membrane lipid asymmetry ATPase subunit MlaF
VRKELRYANGSAKTMVKAGLIAKQGNLVDVVALKVIANVLTLLAVLRWRSVKHQQLKQLCERKIRLVGLTGRSREYLSAELWRGKNNGWSLATKY